MHKFVYENDYEGQLATKVEFTVPSDASLTDMLEQFEYYLKGVGFHIDGNLDIVPEDSFDDTHRGYNPQERFDEYGNYGENNPPVGDSPTKRKKLWDATPEEWNEAYKVTMNYNGKPIE